jgi:hypothetical protein
MAGLVGVALGAGFGYLIAAAMRIFYVVRFGGISCRELLTHITPIMYSLLLPTALVIGFEYFFSPRPALRLIISGAVFFFATLA